MVSLKPDPGSNPDLNPHCVPKYYCQSGSDSDVSLNPDSDANSNLSLDPDFARHSDISFTRDSNPNSNLNLDPDSDQICLREDVAQPQSCKIVLMCGLNASRLRQLETIPICTQT